MRPVIATALLVVLVATPALALVCEVRCETPGAREPAGHSAHGHHDAARDAAVTAPVSGLQASGQPRNCATHVAAEAATPERSWLACDPMEPSGRALADGHADPTGTSAFHALRPPLLARAAAPLRI
jgi:hypothetical protein